jgi:hypothetical protein
MVLTYKNKFNIKYGFEKDESHSLEEISKLTNYDIDGLNTIYDKGFMAYFTSPNSVRPHIKSPNEWAAARVYASIFPNSKSSKIDKNHLIKIK